jgi:GTPase SAR1 family protein
MSQHLSSALCLSGHRVEYLIKQHVQVSKRIASNLLAMFAVVFDQQESFEKAKKWLFELYRARGEDLVIALVGNKIDLPNRQVTADVCVACQNNNNNNHVAANEWCECKHQQANRCRCRLVYSQQIVVCIVLFGWTSGGIGG